MAGLRYRLLLASVLASLLVAIGAASAATQISAGEGLHRVSGTVYESQSGYMRGATVTLGPTGQTATTSLSDGSFAIEDVADGDYTIKISPRCTPFGCYGSTPVTIDGSDLVLAIYPVAGVTPEPGTHQATFENGSTHPASGLYVRGAPYFGHVSVIDQPDGCPDPVVSLGGTDATINWGVACVLPGESVTVYATGDCHQCGISILEPAEWRYDALGDVNCTNGTNAIDALLIVQRAAMIITALLCFQNADVNYDGATNALDAALVLQFDAGLLPSLGPWPVQLGLPVAQ